jgi:hypothetical protein
MTLDIQAELEGLSSIMLSTIEPTASDKLCAINLEEDISDLIGSSISLNPNKLNGSYPSNYEKPKCT